MFIWLTHPPIHQAAAQNVVAVPPEPGVVDVGVPMAQCDIVVVGGQLAHDRVFVMREPGRVLANARQKFW
jgi:hypothetical protein